MVVAQRPYVNICYATYYEMVRQINAISILTYCSKFPRLIYPISSSQLGQPFISKYQCIKLNMNRIAKKYRGSKKDQTLYFSTPRNISEKLLLAGKFKQYLQMTSAVNNNLFRKSPILLVYRATAMLFSEYSCDTILEELSRAEAFDKAGSIKGEINALRAVLQSHTKEPKTSINLLKSSLRKINSNDTFFKNLIERNLGIVYTITNDLRNATIWFEHLLQSSYSLKDWNGVLASYNYLSFIRKVQGRLNEAGIIYKKALGFIDEKGLSRTPYGIKILAGYGHLLLKWHRIREAKHYIRRAIQIAKETDILYGCTAFQNLSEALLRENNARSALSVIHELRKLIQNKAILHISLHLQHTLAVEARIHLEMGRNDRTYAWLSSINIDHLSADELIQRFGFEVGLILPLAARIYINRGELDQAVQVLELIIPKFLHQGANTFLIRSLSMLAVAYHLKSQRDKALNTLKKAIMLAQPENNLGDFLIVGGQLVPILKEIKDRKNGSDFINRLIGVLSAFTVKEVYSNKAIQDLNSLSRREKEVLELIAKGMTNKEIAGELFLSSNTIKSHSIKIYRKLNVNNRKQAVSKARILGVLPSKAMGIYTTQAKLYT